jgi:hypothetical protein
MANRELLNTLVQQKIERQAELRAMKRNLEDLDTDLVGSKFSRFFGTGYWVIKRWLTLILGLILFVFGCVFWLAPEVIYNEDEPLYHEVYNEYESVILTEMGDDIVKFADAVVREDDLSMESLSNAIDETMRGHITQRMKDDLSAGGFLFVLLAIFLLYVSRQAKHVRRRNKQMSEAETLTQELARSFQQVIDNEEDELDQLKRLLRSM